MSTGDEIARDFTSYLDGYAHGKVQVHLYNAISAMYEAVPPTEAQEPIELMDEAGRRFAVHVTRLPDEDPEDDDKTTQFPRPVA